MNEFAVWIKFRMRDKGWDHYDLAHWARLPSAAVSDVLAGRHRPGLRFCAEVARALDEPLEKVLRLAGFDSQEVKEEDLQDELLRSLDHLTLEEREHIKCITRALASARKRPEGSSAPRLRSRHAGNELS